MILSSSDILRVLGADAIIRQEARLAIVEGRPGLGTDDTVYIYIEKYPTIEEFEATWKIWVQDNSGMGKYVLDAMTSLLPNFDFKGDYYTTTDFASDRTVIKTQEEIDREEFKSRFSGLQKGLEDRLNTVRDGRDGKDGVDGVDGLPGKDGRDGRDGRDGKDLVATEAELFDLNDVEQGIQIEAGQVLTWDGAKWTNLFVRQSYSPGGVALGDGGTGVGGDTGVSSTIGWTYHPHDHTEEPNSGHFHSDSADGELVTVFHVSKETSRGNDVEVLLRDLLDQGYDRIYVALSEDLSQAHLYSITSYTETVSGFEINVTHVETAGLEPDYQNAKLYEFLFTKSAPAPGSVDNVTIISETTPVQRDNGDDLIQGDSWYVQSTDQLYLWIDGAWEEIKDGGGVGGVLNSFWKFKDDESAGWDDGKFRVNSHQNKTDWSLTTEIYIAYKNDDGNNTKNYILQLIKPGQYVYVQRRDRPDAYVIFEVDAVPVDADPKGATIDVTFVTQGPDVSDITNEKLCGLTFSLVTGTGGSGGATTLAELTDTNVVNPQNTDLLVYRNGFWTSETPASTCDYTVSDGGDFDSGTAQETGCDGIGVVGVVELNDLSDVDTTGVTEGEALVWDGTQWTAGTGPEPGTLFSTAFRYTTDTSLAPGGGNVQFDSTTYSSVTLVAFSKLDRQGRDTSEFLNDIVGEGFKVYFEQEGDATRGVLFEITGAPIDFPGHVRFPVSLVSETGQSLQTGNDVITQFESPPPVFGVKDLEDFDGTLLEEGATLVWDAVNQIFKQAQHGADGITSAAYKYKNTLTGNPSNGHIALDNADPTLATEIRVHKTTTNNVDLSAVFSMGLGLAQGLYIQRKDDASEAHAYRTTGSAVDQGDYIAVPIEHVGGTGTFTNNKTMVIGVYARSEAHKISPVTAPASSTAAGTAGEVRYDANYFYICVADNLWKRFTLETW